MSGNRRERPSGMIQFNLLGKHWLTVLAAAHYCGVHEDTFAKRANEYGLHPRNFMGKKLYERAELYRAIHQAPLWGVRQAWSEVPPISMEGMGVSKSVGDALQKLRRTVPRSGGRKDR